MSRVPDANLSTPSALQALAQVSVEVRSAVALHDRAAAHVLDWLACAAHGVGSAQGLAFARWLDGQSIGAVPTLAGRMCDAAAAAAYHGALGSTLEMDDVHRSAVLHPGPVVIPAVLAACTASTTGAQFLSAVISGYEAMIRVGQALGPSHYAMWHTTATAGCFGAAAGAAAVLQLDVTHTAQALALAGTRAGGLWQVRHESNLGKAWHMAGAARDGLAAAQLAQAGLTGPLGVLDGPSGWFAATAREADVGCISAPRATPWIDDVSFKPWPACRHAHPAIDALQQAASGHHLMPAAVAHIEVHSYADALRFCDHPEPRDDTQARFSIQHALAACVAWGEPQLAHYGMKAVADPVVVALRQRISLHSSAVLQAAYPAHYGARVLIHWQDGTRSEASLADTRGDPARPMSLQARRSKAHMLMHAAGWAPGRIDHALAACTALPQASNLASLHKVFKP